MSKAQIMKFIRQEYEKALEDETFANREEAAFNAADNAALGSVWQAHGIRCAADSTPEMRAEADALRVEAIGR